MKALLVSLVFLAQLSYAEKQKVVTTLADTTVKLTQAEASTLIGALTSSKGVLTGEAATIAAKLPAGVLVGAKNLFGNIKSPEQAVEVSATLTKLYAKMDGNLADAIKAVGDKSPETVAALNVDSWNPTSGVEALFASNASASETASGPLAQLTTVEATQRTFELALGLVNSAEANLAQSATNSEVAQKNLASAKARLTGYLQSIKAGKANPIELGEMNSLAYVLIQAYNKANTLKLTGSSKELYNALAPLTVLLSKERGFFGTVKSKQFVQALVTGLLLSKETPDATQLALIQGAYRSLTGEVVPADVKPCFDGDKDLPTDQSLNCHRTASCMSKS